MLSGLNDHILQLADVYIDFTGGKCRTILLDGFSEPITHRLSAKMRNRDGLYQVIRVQKASVVEGAALSQAGLTSTVRAEKHYGTEIWDLYDNRTDLGVPFIWDPYTETKTVKRVRRLIHFPYLYLLTDKCALPCVNGQR